MKQRVRFMLVGVLALLIAACGLTESEVASLADPTYVDCPKRAPISFEQAALSSELIVHARPTDSFFVDHCHRAFLLDVETAWLGEIPEPVLAIIQVDPFHHAQQWADLDRGETALFLLERDPDVPEAFRPVGEGGVIPVHGELAQVCLQSYGFSCDKDVLEISALYELFADLAVDNPDMLIYEAGAGEELHGPEVGDDLLDGADIEGNLDDPEIIDSEMTGHEDILHDDALELDGHGGLDGLDHDGIDLAEIGDA